MSTTPSIERRQRRERRVVNRPAFLAWLPWEKISIWGLFLLAVYALSHFFFIIFMTFIIAYTMRGIVARLSRLVSPHRERVWLERCFTLVCFALLLFGLYEAGNYLVPKLKSQADELIGRVKNLDPFQDFKTIVRKTVGPFLFRQRYGDEKSLEYQKEFNSFNIKGNPQVADFQTFGEMDDNLERKFDAPHLEKREEERLKQQLGEKRLEEEFERYFSEQKAPAIYRKDEAKHQEEWRAWYERNSRILGNTPLEEFEQEPEFEAKRDKQICKRIAQKLREESPADWDRQRQEWLKGLAKEAVAQLKGSPTYGDYFRSFYESERSLYPKGYPYDYEQYVRLREARPQGEVAFSEALRELGLAPVSDEERIAQAHRSFRAQEEEKLSEEFWKSGLPEGVRSTLIAYADETKNKLGGWVIDALRYLLTIPVQLILSLLLSFFIAWDVPNLSRGLKKLEQSRVRDFYLEIAPGLMNFGRLIGRAFEAQGVIAFFNSVLTFAAIKALGIQNEVFLCAIVFLCSFIPIVGVVISSIPIAIMALIQPGGTIWLALQAIGAIVIIHFIETSVLNPKILGDMLHLHPVLVLAVLAVGQHFFGVWGLLLGVPVTVFIIRSVILQEGIPGLIEPAPEPAPAMEGAPGGPAAVELEGPEETLLAEETLSEEGAGKLAAQVPVAAGGSGRKQREGGDR